MAWKLLTLALVFGFAALSHAQSPATRPATTNEVILSAGDDKLLADLAKAYEADPKGSHAKVTVEGTVSSAAESSTGKVFRAYFKEANPQTGFYFVYFSNTSMFKNMETAFGGKSGSGMVGKRVRVTGVVESYNGRPQMVLNSAKQIRIVE